MWTKKGGACIWWLRAPGYGSYAATVSTDGDVGAPGYVYTRGYDDDSDYIAVRPALWVDL